MSCPGRPSSIEEGRDIRLVSFIESFKEAEGKPAKLA
jgi:hypothetical protein